MTTAVASTAQQLREARSAVLDLCRQEAAARDHYMALQDQVSIAEQAYHEAVDLHIKDVLQGL